MKHNVKRINESQLKAIVAESVKRVLKEEAYRESPLYNEYGELIDTGGRYDEEDYYGPDDLDSDYRGERAYMQSQAKDFIDRIHDGEFDDKLHDEKWCDRVNDFYWDGESDCGVIDTIHDRLCMIDKDFAMKYGKNPKTHDPYVVATQKKYPADRN